MDKLSLFSALQCTIEGEEVSWRDVIMLVGDILKCGGVWRKYDKKGKKNTDKTSGNQEISTL